MRYFIEYDPKTTVKIKGKCLGFVIKSQLQSDRVPGKGPDLPPNTLDVTEREAEAKELNHESGDGWLEFAYDAKKDTFTKYAVEDWAEGLAGPSHDN